ncbi:HAMP domain-containing sensor histidine kinase [Lactobacillus sp. YT155]|uniref:sensor histidine kinase n=1 Tax=Lactobacillus sp. YT155 TaxID=3060955 RepID=UPI00265F1F93|nr:HAMP domain-containing sensor histidine kinase [Lactobacillus sp. YT155]MDO1605690.1 HAMP domain-containing sensor histidine kinase [Lactobacillus sp. YT155]
MKKFNYIRKQQLKVFLQTIVGFAVLFLTLGLIIFTLFENTTLSSVDNALTRQTNEVKAQAQFSDSLFSEPNENIIPSQGQDNGATFPIQGQDGESIIPSQEQQNNDSNNYGDTQQKIIREPKVIDVPFKANVLIFNSNGRLLNKDSLGNRYSIFKKIKPLKRNIGIKKTISVRKMSFRSYLIKFDDSIPNSKYSGNYVYILQNVDAENAAITNFKNVLIITFVIFWLLSLILAYILTVQNMKPVLKSWRQQAEFVNDAAHELRTPLAIIQGKLELMLTKPNEKIVDEAESISVSLGEIKRLTSLSNDLLTLAKTDTDVNSLTLEKFTPKEVLQPTVDTFNEVAISQNKQLLSNLTVAQNITADPKKVTQVLIILLDNALKYTNEKATIKVEDAIENNKYVLRVTNDGESISSADKKMIFNRFYRINKDRSRDTGGNGLGLSIAKEIVTLHKGKISVSDNVPQGVTFKIELPVNNK